MQTFNFIYKLNYQFAILYINSTRKHMGKCKIDETDLPLTGDLN